MQIPLHFRIPIKNSAFKSFFFKNFPDCSFVSYLSHTSSKKVCTVVDRKDWTLHIAIEVKLPWLRAVPAGQEWILTLEKWIHFFLGPWLLVYQFIDISNQMESTGEVSNVVQKNLYNALLYEKILSMFDTSPVGSIWLEMSINWYTKSQGPKKKCFHFSSGRIMDQPLARPHCL